MSSAAPSLRRLMRRPCRVLTSAALPLYALIATVMLVVQSWTTAVPPPPPRSMPAAFAVQASSSGLALHSCGVTPTTHRSLRTLLDSAPTKYTAARRWNNMLDALPVMDGLPSPVDGAGVPWGNFGRNLTEEGGILVMLIAFKRCHLLAAQIASVKKTRLDAAAFHELEVAGYAMPAYSSLLNYSVSRIIVLQNGAHCSVEPALAAHPDVLYMNSSRWNTKFYGRFLPSLISDEQFTLLLDDDIVVEERALANLLRAMALHDHHAVVSGMGKTVKIAPGATFPFMGYNEINGQTMGNCNDARKGDDTLVDYVTNVYLFPTLFARTLFAPGVWQYTLDNGEDSEWAMERNMTPVCLPLFAGDRGFGERRV